MTNKVVVYLTAACGPSQQMRKALKKAVAEKEIEVEVVIIDADPARIKAMKVMAVPTTHIIDKNDKVIKMLVGYNPNIIKRIKEFI